MEEVSRPIRANPAPAFASHVPSILFAIWLCGVLVGLICWMRVWRHMRVVRLAARPLDLEVPIDVPIPVLSSPTRVEPGVFGIHRPVLLLPDGIRDHLTPAQLEAVLGMSYATCGGATISLARFICWWRPYSGSTRWCGGSARA